MMSFIFLLIILNTTGTVNRIGTSMVTKSKVNLLPHEETIIITSVQKIILISRKVN